MTGRRFLKDKWILDAIANGYLKPLEDGSVLKRKWATKDGKSMSDEWVLVKPRVHKKSGRVYWNLTWKGFTKSVLVNRVIALRFLPNPHNLPQVNHVDGNKENNALRNADGSFQLEWSSGSDNEKHAHRTGLKTGRGSQNSNAKLTAAQVVEIRAAAEPIETLMSRYGVARSTLHNIIKRKTWTHL